MVRSILVPLDRTPFAERALPLALGFARRTGARLRLIEIHGPEMLGNIHAGWVPFEPELDAELRRTERLYLDATARLLASVSPVAVSTAQPAGSAITAEAIAAAILGHIREVRADLIVTATHGRGPRGRLVSGSVAHSLVRHAGIPVLLVRPTGPEPAAISEVVPEQVLIPLDGSEMAERVLEPAAELARAAGAGCLLLQVAETNRRGRNGGGACPEEYLERVAGGIRRQGLDVTTRVIAARDAASAIAAEAGRPGDRLVAMSTHGRGGLSRLVMGSVAEQVLRATPTPVLVYRPTGVSAPRPAWATAGA